jgi:aminomethyltransferase
MSTTSLLQKFGLQAVPGQYAGAETVLRFGSGADSVARELDALRHGCGVFDLGWRGKLVVSGEDRVRWLNGMVTNNTRDLAQDFGNFSFVLNAQGRIQGDLLAFQRGEFYVLESDAAQIGVIREFLDKFIIMDEVEIGDISGKLTSIGVAGPQAAEVLRGVLSSTLRDTGLMAPDLRPGQITDGHWEGRGFSLVRDPVPARGWYELWLAPESVEAFWNALVAGGAVPVGAEALEWQRILLGIPRMGMDLGGREMVQETGQSFALNNAKGCYIGQEIVERIRARGQVHRSFVGLIVDGEPPARGSKVMAGDKEAGEVTSSAAMVVDGVARTLGLGYVRSTYMSKSDLSKGDAGNGDESLSNASSGESLQVEGRAVRIAALPFEF